MADYEPRVIETLGAEIVFGKRSQVAHVLDPLFDGSRDGYLVVALCGLSAWSRSNWLGLGSYQEWERGRRMPLCLNCLRAIKDRGLFGYDDGKMVK